MLLEKLAKNAWKIIIILINVLILIMGFLWLKIHFGNTLGSNGNNNANDTQGASSNGNQNSDVSTSNNFNKPTAAASTRTS